MTNSEKQLLEAAAKILRGEQEESIELEEAVSSEVEKIMDSISELPESEMKGFLKELYKVFDKKAQEEREVPGKKVYPKIARLFDSAFILWLQASPDRL